MDKSEHSQLTAVFSIQFWGQFFPKVIVKSKLKLYDSSFCVLESLIVKLIVVFLLIITVSEQLKKVSVNLISVTSKDFVQSRSFW